MPGSNDTIASLKVDPNVSQQPLSQLAITSVGTGLTAMQFDSTGAYLAVATSSGVAVYRVSNGQLTLAASTNIVGVRAVVWTTPPAVRQSSMTQLASACDSSTARAVGGTAGDSGSNTTTTASSGAAAAAANVQCVASSLSALLAIGLFVWVAL